jgi:hypothetical protein
MLYLICICNVCWEANLQHLRWGLFRFFVGPRGENSEIRSMIFRLLGIGGYHGLDDFSKVGDWKHHSKIGFLPIGWCSGHFTPFKIWGFSQKTSAELTQWQIGAKEDREFIWRLYGTAYRSWYLDHEFWMFWVRRIWRSDQVGPSLCGPNIFNVCHRLPLLT